MGIFRRKKRQRTDDPSLVGFGAETPTPPPPAAPTGPAPSPGDEFERLVDREWARLAAVGTWWTGGERLAIAADARLAHAGDPPSGILPRPVEEATRRVAVEAATIRGTDVARWEMEGLNSFAYVEIVGIVARLAAIEATAFGLGHKERLLPEPLAGEPSCRRADGAAITTGWAPTVGPAAARSSLSAVPAEAEAMLDLQDVLYLPPADIDDWQAVRDGLTRSQIELAAARAAALDRCVHLLLGHAARLGACIDSLGRSWTPGPVVSGVGPTGVAHGAEIIAFVDSVVLRDEYEIDNARATLDDRIGPTATDRVAMVAGHLSMMNRAVDAIGAPVERGADQPAQALGITIPPHLASREVRPPRPAPAGSGRSPRRSRS